MFMHTGLLRLIANSQEILLLQMPQSLHHLKLRCMLVKLRVLAVLEGSIPLCQKYQAIRNRGYTN